MKRVSPAALAVTACLGFVLSPTSSWAMASADCLYDHLSDASRDELLATFEPNHAAGMGWSPPQFELNRVAASCIVGGGTPLGAIKAAIVAYALQEKLTHALEHDYHLPFWKLQGAWHDLSPAVRAKLMWRVKRPANPLPADEVEPIFAIVRTWGVKVSPGEDYRKRPGLFAIVEYVQTSAVRQVAEGEFH